MLGSHRAVGRLPVANSRVCPGAQLTRTGDL